MEKLRCRHKDWRVLHDLLIKSSNKYAGSYFAQCKICHSQTKYYCRSNTAAKAAQARRFPIKGPIEHSYPIFLNRQQSIFECFAMHFSGGDEVAKMLNYYSSTGFEPIHFQASGENGTRVLVILKRDLTGMEIIRSSVNRRYKGEKINEF